MVDVIVFGPHPDDIEICAGGLVLTLRRQGYSVGGVDLTRGESGTRGTRADREREAAAGARLLGLAFRENLGLRDGALVSDEPSRDLVIDVLRRHRPRLVVAPFPKDDHPDHAHAGQLVKDARFLAGCARIGPVGEPWRPGRVLFYPSRELLMPSLIVDISDVFEEKLAAVRAHASQLHDARSREPGTTISSPDFLPAIEAGNRHYGGLIGARFGEPYVVEGPLAIDDPVPVVRDRSHGNTGRRHVKTGRAKADTARGDGRARRRGATSRRGSTARGSSARGGAAADGRGPKPGMRGGGARR